MPTFEKCQQCVKLGVPVTDAPIVQEGKWCDRCVRDATDKALGKTRCDCDVHRAASMGPEKKDPG